MFTNWPKFQHCADLSQFKTNVVGVTHTINAFLPLLRAGKTKRVIVVSSTMGSPQFTLQTAMTFAPAYSISKAGLNMAVAKFAAAYKDEGILFLNVSPGFVKTMAGREYSFSTYIFIAVLTHLVGAKAAEIVDKFYETQTEYIRKSFPQFVGAITVEQSINATLALLDRITPAESGVLLDASDEDRNTANST